MTSIATKRVYDPPSPDDGFRVLVDRLWPRGVTKQAAALDLWAKDLAPSPDLRKAFNHRPERFAEFTRHYLRELSKNPAVTVFRAELKRPKVTLLYGAHDRMNNHALVLADFLNVQIICTFNHPLSMVDSALMRKGRLIAKYEFGKLSTAKARRLSNHLGFNKTVGRPMTIAEIACQGEKEHNTQRIEVIGFRRDVIEN